MFYFFSCHSINADNWWRDSKGWPGFACCVTTFFPSVPSLHCREREGEGEGYLLLLLSSSSRIFLCFLSNFHEACWRYGRKASPFEILLTCSKLRADGIFYLTSGTILQRKHRCDINISKSLKIRKYFMLIWWSHKIMKIFNLNIPINEYTKYDKILSIIFMSWAKYQESRK